MGVFSHAVYLFSDHGTAWLDTYTLTTVLFTFPITDCTVHVHVH